MATGRDSRGRFQPGCEGGPGRPLRPTEAEYLTALSEAVSVDVWREICQRAAQDAIAGDPRARDWLARYLLGSNVSLQLRAEDPLEDRILVCLPDNGRGNGPTPTGLTETG